MIPNGVRTMYEWCSWNNGIAFKPFDRLSADKSRDTVSSQRSSEEGPSAQQSHVTTSHSSETPQKTLTNVDDTLFCTLSEAILQIKKVLDTQLNHYILDEALRHTNKLFVVGRNDHYQFGLNHKEKIAQLTDWNENISAQKVNVSLAGLIVTDAEGNIWSMGANQHGECAVSDEYVLKPNKISFFEHHHTKIKHIFTNANGSSVFWVTENDETYANGSNTSHQLGVGDASFHFIPIRISQLKNIIKISSADRYSLALSADGSVYSTTHSKYGGNAHGQNTNDDNYGWKRIRSLDGIHIIDIDNGSEHSLFLSSKGTVYSAGRGDHHRLGYGARGANSAILPIPYFTKNRVFITQIACGRAHNLCIDKAQNVWSWGSNFVGQCASGKLVRSCSPQMISSLKGKKAIDIKCGAEHSFVGTEENEHFLFGSNKHNECSLVNVDANAIHVPYAIDHVVHKETGGDIKEVNLGCNSTIIIISGLFSMEKKAKETKHDPDETKQELKKNQADVTQTQSTQNDQEITKKAKETKKILINEGNVAKVPSNTVSSPKNKENNEKHAVYDAHTEIASELEQTLSSTEAFITSLNHVLSNKQSEIITPAMRTEDERKEQMNEFEAEPGKNEEEDTKEDLLKIEIDREKEKIRQLKKQMEPGEDCKHVDDEQPAQILMESSYEMVKKSNDLNGEKLAPINFKPGDAQKIEGDPFYSTPNGEQVEPLLTKNGLITRSKSEPNDGLNPKEKQLLKEWNLKRYEAILMDEGYESVSKWMDLDFETLKRMKFKPGHAKRFIRKRKQFFSAEQ